MTMKSIVLEELAAVARDQKKSVPSWADDVELMDTEFDSLCFAIFVARMEDRTGVDPFSDMAVADLPVTVADLVALYEGASAMQPA